MGKCCLSREATANILSYAVMIDGGNDVSYDKVNDEFILKPAGSRGVYSFCRKNVSGREERFYCCHMKTMVQDEPTTYPELNDHAMIETVENNLTRYTKREIAGADRARLLLAKMGFPSARNAIDIATRGTKFDVTARDFAVAEDIYGKDIATMKGKTKKRVSICADITVSAAVVQVEEVLSIDVMFVDGVPSLIGLATPLDLTMAVTLSAFDSAQGPRSTAVVKKGIDGFIATLTSRNFVTRMILSDSEGAVGKIKKDLNMLGIEVDISGAGGHVARIERKIQTVKERLRAYIAHQLPFTLTYLGVAMLVLFCVSRLNYQVSSVSGSGESPRVMFSGRQTDGKIDSRAGFGEYAQCTVPNTNNTMESRMEDCIVMLPTENRTGSVKMMSISAGKLITRDQFKILPMPYYIITRLDDMATAEGRKLLRRFKMVYNVEGGLRRTEEPTYLRPTQDPAGNMDPVVTASPYSLLDMDEGEREEYQFDPAMVNDIMGYPEDYDAPIVPGGQFNMQDLDVGELEEFSAVEPGEYHHADASLPCAPPGNTQTSVNTNVSTTYSSETGANLGETYGDHDVALYADRTSHIESVSEERAMNITVKEALKSRGEEAKRVIKKELKQMLDKRVWTPMHVSKLSATEKRSIMRSQMFLKEKYLPTEKFEKLKARLVAGGNRQDKDLYDDISSPTVSTSAVMMVFAVAAFENRKGSVMDIRGAFLNAKTGKAVVYMRLDPTMSSILNR